MKDIKNTRKDSEKNHAKNIKISLKGKKKRLKKIRERYQNLPEEQKQKSLEYMRKYYAACNK